jgi:uncharacterized repeat protein (TIGR03837 family)
MCAMNFPVPHPAASQPTAASLAIFCKVVDNYGDIGICWRFARQVHDEHGLAVTLWVDDLHSFRRIWPSVDVDVEVQRQGGVTVRHWRAQDGAFDATDIPDIVIEFFGCELPEGYVAAMAQRTPRPVWLNLEGLTAEEWVEGCHTLPSTHPRLPLVKHFFFPGFTAKTGGLMREARLDAERRRFQADPAAMRELLARCGLASAEMDHLKVSLFCYPHAPVAALFAAWQDNAAPVVCLVPEGVAPDAVAAFLEAPATAGAHATRGALTVRVMPFLAQPDYDKLLWACDLIIVRGEDSFVRAQWAGRPFIWHIYPQDDELHHKKLRAFLQRYASGIDSLCGFSLRWNDASAGAQADGASWPALWQALQDELASLGAHAQQWQEQMAANGEMTANLLAFADALRR